MKHLGISKKTPWFRGTTSWCSPLKCPLPQAQPERIHLSRKYFHWSSPDLHHHRSPPYLQFFCNPTNIQEEGAVSTTCDLLSSTKKMGQMCFVNHCLQLRFVFGVWELKTIPKRSQHRSHLCLPWGKLDLKGAILRSHFELCWLVIPSLVMVRIGCTSNTSNGHLVDMTGSPPTRSSEKIPCAGSKPNKTQSRKIPGIWTWSDPLLMNRMQPFVKEGLNGTP